MEKEAETIEYITRTDLEEQTQILLKALDTRFGKMESSLGKSINDVKDELYIVRDELKVDINSNQTLIDGYVKAQEDFRQEFVIMKEEMKQIKRIIKEKLGLEISAV
jgi:hypothetical protein